VNIQHNVTSQSFTAGEANQPPAELAYELPAPGLVDFVHTFVPEARRGQGEADALARAGLAFARAQHLRVRTSCPFMAAFVARHHAEYAAILEAI